MRGLRQNQMNTPNSIYENDQVINSIYLVILIVERLRVKAPPTHFEKFLENFKIEIPRNRTKILIFPESALFTDLIPMFQNTKIGNTKKLF